MTKLLQVSRVAAILIVFAVMASIPLKAGTIALTGHDDDYHCNYGPNYTGACQQLAALVSFARNGSSLPILMFDAGTELTSALTGLGLAYTNINPDTPGAVTASLFNSALYSALVVASDTTCGGCDNNAAGEAAIAAQSSAINAFLNNGGGIVGLAGAFSTAYYSFVPQTATSVGGAPDTGYSQTAAGSQYGVVAVNDDQTHNLFYNPGTNGESSFYQVAEVNSFGNGTISGPNAAATLLCYECTASGGVITSGGGSTSISPEPASSAMLGLAALTFGLAAALRRKLCL